MDVRAQGRCALIALAAIACGTGEGLGGTAEPVTRGPYLQLATPDSMIVRWRTAEATSSRVIHGLEPNALSTSVEDPTLTTEHAVTLTGLEAGGTVCYAVGDLAELFAGGDAEHCFRSPPVRGSRLPLRAWILGDSGTGNAAQRDVRDAYYGYPGATDTDLWLMLGDNAYPDASDSQLQSRLFDVYPEMLRRAPLWPTIGNHNGSSDSPTQTGPYFDAFDLPRGGEAGGIPSGTEAYYAFDWANVHFVVLDSFDTSVALDGAMLTWLAADLAATAQDWVIVYFHHPPYSKGSRDSDLEAKQILMRERVVPLLDDYGVDLTLTGHSHSYERSFLIAGHYDDSSTFDPSMQIQLGNGNPAGDGAYAKPVVGPDPHSGIVYGVAGSSGQVDEAPLNHPAMAVSLALHGSLVLDVDGQRLDMRFLDRFGTVLDHVALTKAAGVQPPEASFERSPAIGAVPLQVAFTDQSDNTPTAWSWDFDDDGKRDSAQQNPSHTFEQRGRYTVTLVASNAAGASSSVIADAVCAYTDTPPALSGLGFDDHDSLRWDAAPDAVAYEVVRGPLEAIRQGAGWNDGCLLGTASQPALPAPSVPGPDGWAYLVQVVDCAANAQAFDSGGSGQIAPREIANPPTCGDRR